MRFVCQSKKKKSCDVMWKLGTTTQTPIHNSHTQSHRQRTVKIQDACITLTVVYAVIERHFPLRKHPYDYNHSSFF